jgi:hypothetical protein
MLDCFIGGFLLQYKSLGMHESCATGLVKIARHEQLAIFGSWRILPGFFEENSVNNSGIRSWHRDEKTDRIIRSNHAADSHKDAVDAICEDKY